MVSIEIPAEYGYVIAVALALWFQQAVIFVIPIGMQRMKTKISPPTLYPTDRQIKELALTDQQVDNYMCAQRVHQNNMEFLVVFFPMLLIAGLENAKYTAIAGAAVWLGRLVTAIGYWHGAGKRVIGGWFHFPEFYIIYLVGLLSYKMISKIP